MKKLGRTITATLSLSLAVCTGFAGYKYIDGRPLKGELSDTEKWDKALNDITEPLDDFEVIYAQEEANNIEEVVQTNGDIVSGLLPAGEIETFDLSFLDEGQNEESKSGNSNSSGGISNYINSQPTGTASSVPKVPTKQYSVPAGNWCTYQGTALTGSAFSASAFDAKYRNVCQNVYNLALSGKPSQATFNSKADYDKANRILVQKYGIISYGYGEKRNGQVIGYYGGIDNSRVHSASRAETIVQQIFPNGATANQVVWGCCNWLKNNTRYSAGTPSSNTLLTQGYGNCNAYASALKQMCNAMGVQCDIVAGQAYSYSSWGGHAWNMVYINGVAYNVDPCFYATSGGNGSYVLSPNVWSDHRNGVVNNAYINS